MSFNAKALMGNRYLVAGTDFTGAEGAVVIDGTQWNQVVSWDKSKRAQATFDEAVNSFFAPLLEAAEAMEQEHVGDSIGTLVLEEGTEGTAGVPAKVVQLTKDSIILRLIENNETDRLIWVYPNLEVLEAEAKTETTTTDEDLPPLV